MYSCTIRSWSHKDKYNFIGLSQSNLRVQYRGHGKTHKGHSIYDVCGGLGLGVGVPKKAK